MPNTPSRAFLHAAALLSVAFPLSASGADCSASDAALLAARATVCASLVGTETPWCPAPPNTTSDGDWPSQATYLTQVPRALVAAGAASCLTTPAAAGVAAWLDGPASNASLPGSPLQTWVGFQASYFVTPRPPGSRLESPGTLGRKCWAFAWLAATWDGGAALRAALGPAGLSAETFIAAYDAALPATVPLCDAQLANCFVNQTVSPSRNGTCPLDVVAFHLGFGDENLKRGLPLAYPFFP